MARRHGIIPRSDIAGGVARVVVRVVSIEQVPAPPPDSSLYFLAASALTFCCLRGRGVGRCVLCQTRVRVANPKSPSPLVRGLRLVTSSFAVTPRARRAILVSILVILRLWAPGPGRVDAPSSQYCD